MENFNNPLVSIVMPVYNAEKYLKQSLDSILNQTYTHLEILICDDASTDNSRYIIESYSDERIIFFNNPENKGYLKTCNKLLLLAKGEYVTFQDADDISMPNRIERMLDSCKTGVQICTSNYLHIDEGNSFLKNNEFEIDYFRFKDDAVYRTYFCGASIFVSRELIEKYGVYDEFFDRLGAEDYEWFYRLVKMSNCSCFHVKEILYKYRTHESAVKIGNVNIRKYFILDLVFLIRKTWIEQGRYLLSAEHRGELEQIALNKELFYTQNPAQIYIYHSQTLINAKRYMAAIGTALKAVYTQPLFWSGYANFVYVCYCVIRRLVV